MTKNEFLNSLESRIAGLPEGDIRRSIEYYAEALDDRVEEGMSEDEAVADLPSMDEIVSQILSEVPLSRLMSNRLKPKRRLTWWEITLLALGSPLWISLLVVAAALALFVFVTLFAVTFVFYATAFATAAVGAIRFLGGVGTIFAGDMATAAMLVGVGLLCVGVAILLYLLTNKIEKPIWKAAKKLWIWIKCCFVKEVKV